MKKIVIITGAGGFIGANLTHRLVKENCEVHVITRPNSSLWRLKTIKKRIIVHEGLLHNKKKLSQHIKKIRPSSLYHLATYGSYPMQQNVQRMIDTNITYTQNLLEAVKDIPYTRLIVSGASTEYGKKNKPMSESDKLEPINTCAATKAGATYLCQLFAKTFHKPLIIFRLFNVYGPYEEEGRLVRSVIEFSLQGKPIKLATGREARDLIFVDDVIDAFLHGGQRKKIEGDIFNVGTGKQTTILQLAKKVISLVGHDSPIQIGAYSGRPWDTYYWKADMRKTKKILGWEAKTSLDDGLKKTIHWYKEQLHRG